MIDLTDEKIKDGLLSLVEQEGADFVYERHSVLEGPRCAYVHEGKPDCIVGRLLHANGVPLDVLRDADERDEYAGVAADELLADLSREQVLKTSQHGRTVLYCVQSLQDKGVPWGRAVTEALELFN